MALMTGDRVPAFKLMNQYNEIVDIENFAGKVPMVIFFYPKDNTPGCTAEVCAFNDSYSAFEKAGVEVIGISSDSPDSHGAFALKYGLQFNLLSDTHNKVRRLFGVPRSMLGLLPGRVTYIIDGDGIIRKVINSQLIINKHIAASLSAIGQM
jgi:thioredoxin-dependent peroxiredoxin